MTTFAFTQPGNGFLGLNSFIDVLTEYLVNYMITQTILYLQIKFQKIKPEKKYSLPIELRNKPRKHRILLFT